MNPPGRMLFRMPFDLVRPRARPRGAVARCGAGRSRGEGEGGGSGGGAEARRADPPEPMDFNTERGA